MYIKTLATCLAQSKYLIIKAIIMGEIMVTNNSLNLRVFKGCIKGQYKMGVKILYENGL